MLHHMFISLENVNSFNPFENRVFKCDATLNMNYVIAYMYTYRQAYEGCECVAI
jgi:hypothetical protein